jgi:large subunit ribosomal protein L28
MSRVCQVTGKRPMVGNIVSHSNIKSKTRSLPNLQKHRFWVANQKKWVTLKLSAHGLRIVNKRGIERVVAELEAAGDL